MAGNSRLGVWRAKVTAATSGEITPRMLKSLDIGGTYRLFQDWGI